MAWLRYCKKKRLLSFLLLVFHAVMLCSPASGFLKLPSLPSLQRTSSPENFRKVRILRTITTNPPLSQGGSFAGEIYARRQPTSRLWMSYAAPPVKPPKLKTTGGGGRGDDLYVRELVEPEKSVILSTWRDYAKASGSSKFTESIRLSNEMIAWRSGVIAARKRQFTLACCKGQKIQAVACVQIAPRNDDVRSFISKEGCMSLRLLNVDPSSPQFKAGTHICKEIKEIGKLEKMAVDFTPIKDIYSGRFYAATLTM